MPSQKPAREAASLRETLRKIGYNGDLTSKIRDSLLGVGRIVSYVEGMGSEWIPFEGKAHLDTQHRDIASLSDYDLHLMNKVQLLLDATIGLISIEQNSTIKVLTVVSVVGVPPTLVASLYGMNFHYMPELSWTFGYPFGLALIALSAIVPLAWFKLRGWL
jgi:magnesium transporter